MSRTTQKELERRVTQVNDLFVYHRRKALIVLDSSPEGYRLNTMSGKHITPRVVAKQMRIILDALYEVSL